MWGRKDEEYIADICAVSRRSLTEEEHRLFTMHMVNGLEWHECIGKLQISRGNFFHEVYRIEQKLGRVFAELMPYALYPLDEYFGGVTRVEGPDPVDRPPYIPWEPEAAETDDKNRSSVPQPQDRRHLLPHSRKFDAPQAEGLPVPTPADLMPLAQFAAAAGD